MPSPYAFTIGEDVFFDPHPGKQVDVLQVLRNRVIGEGEAPANVFLWGNRGSGKSRLVRAFCHACAMAFSGFKYVIVRRNMPDLRQNHTIYMGAEMRKLGGDWNDTLGLAKYANGSIGFYRQCEDEADAEKIVGAEAAVLFVDEATQIKWELLRLLGPSLRVPKVDGKLPYRTCVIYGGNPIGESTEEIWSYFVDQTVDREIDPEYDPKDFLAIEIQRKDNPSIDEAEYRKQFAGLPAHYRAAWLDGVRMDARTLFEVKPTKDGKPYHYIPELPTISGKPLHQVPWLQWYRSFDMGFFPDPAVCVWLAVIGRRIIAVSESTWFRMTVTDGEIQRAMLTQTREVAGHDDVAMTYADPQIDVRTGDIVTVRDHMEIHGVPIECSVNDRVLYADAIHGLLGEEVEPGVPRLQIYEPGCPMLAKYLPKMRWDEKNPRKMADHKFDHWIVCLAYFAISSGVLGASGPDAAPTKRTIGLDWLEEDAIRSRGRRRVS